MLTSFRRKVELEGRDKNPNFFDSQGHFSCNFIEIGETKHYLLDRHKRGSLCLFVCLFDR